MSIAYNCSIKGYKRILSECRLIAIALDVINNKVGVRLPIFSKGGIVSCFFKSTLLPQKGYSLWNNKKRGCLSRTEGLAPACQPIRAGLRSRKRQVVFKPVQKAISAPFLIGKEFYFTNTQTLISCFVGSPQLLLIRSSH